jgi:hypothetical protein
MKFLQNRLRNTSILVIFACAVASTQAATRFIVSGTINQIVRNDSHIELFAEKPFWGPPKYGAGFVLWKADVLFIANVPVAIPITLDGKKAGFDDLKVGQHLVVEYELVLAGNEYCAATRIEARGERRSNDPKLGRGKSTNKKN